ncbi:MAG: TonB-dependent receptor [Proteobacteria bacterium]|nr:TonB-dependent receptor [Pseudomonadota bacterium]
MAASNAKNVTITPEFRKTQLARTISTILFVSTLVAIRPSSVAAQESDSAVLDEVIVTATRREQLINDVPASISVLSGQQLDRMGANGLEDYFTSIPGLSLVDRGPGRNNVIIRGITNDSYGDTATSALYFDEVPVSEASFPDLHTFDVHRIEVLRGPQGTLFGAGSLGGAIRIITQKPNTNEFSARIDTTVESTKGHDVVTRLNLMINAPLIDDKLGVRLVGYSHDVTGYYENINFFRPDDNAGREKMDGGRLAVRWSPTEKLMMDAKVIIQNQDVVGYHAEQRSLAVNTGEYQQDFSSGGKLDDDIKVYGLDFELDLDFATLSSATSYVDQERTFIENVNRYTYYYGYDSTTQDYIFDGFGANADIFVPVSSIVLNDNQTVSQEFRLVSNNSGPLTYTVGMFYSETTSNGNFVDFTDPAGEVHLSALDEAACFFLYDDPCAPSYDPNTVIFDSNMFGVFEDTLNNKSIYGELSYDINDQWSVIAGLRAFDLHMESDEPGVEDYDEDDIIPKLSVQYRLSDDTMLYALYSEGFRRGKFPSSLIRADQEEELASLLDGRRPGEYLPGDQPVIESVLSPNDNLCGIAYPNFGKQIVESDSLKNYEIGAKITLLENRMQLNTTAYYTDWTNLQVIQEINCGSGGNAFDSVSGNQGSAGIFGVEFDLSYQATEGLYLNLSAGYINAELQEDANLIPEGNPFTFVGEFEEPLGRKGDRSPAVPELAWSMSGTYTFPLTISSGNNFEGYVLASYDYQGDSYTKYTERPDERSGDYGILDLRAGVVSDAWELSIFVKNATNDNGLTYVDIIPLTRGNNITRLQPRTIGMNFLYNFGF